LLTLKCNSLYNIYNDVWIIVSNDGIIILFCWLWSATVCIIYIMTCESTLKTFPLCLLIYVLSYSERKYHYFLCRYCAVGTTYSTLTFQNLCAFLLKMLQTLWSFFLKCLCATICMFVCVFVYVFIWLFPPFEGCHI
jgi:hypothetical protein